MGYRSLAAAIVLQAVEDYQHCVSVLSTKNMDKNMVYDARKLKNDCEIFFRSQWYGELTSIAPEKFMRLIEDGIDNAIAPVYDEEKRQYFCECKKLIHKSKITGKTPVVKCKFCGRYIRVHGEPLNNGTR